MQILGIIFIILGLLVGCVLLMTYLLRTRVYRPNTLTLREPKMLPAQPGFVSMGVNSNVLSPAESRRRKLDEQRRNRLAIDSPVADDFSQNAILPKCSRPEVVTAAPSEASLRKQVSISSQSGLPNSRLTAPAVEPVSSSPTTVDPFRAFSVDPVGQLHEAKHEILRLLNHAVGASECIQEVFDKRMHRNTSSDIHNFLLLKRLIEALSTRVAKISEVLRKVEDEMKINITEGFELAHGDLVLSSDSFTTVTKSAEFQSIERSEWGPTIKLLVSRLGRKKTFYDAFCASSALTNLPAQPGATEATDVGRPKYSDQK